ncbi:hypothetical protein EV426DRAFT_534670 [Tirmania nivea]|nr:hypothetical protein EV426DRAFT_534670 [Tirmania nivea]
MSHITIPGYPYERHDIQGIKKFLDEQFRTQALNELFPLLWLVATQKHDHISALHHQGIRGRQIVITDDPRLHLLWYYGTVYIKPIPEYIVDDNFRKSYVIDSGDPELIHAVNGFLRSWSYLIKCQADFDIAFDQKLLPRQWRDESKTFHHISEFLLPYRGEPEHEGVTKRYHYGELRLTRVNFYNRLYRHELYYHKTHGQYGSYFGRFMDPFLFVFGSVSVILSAMQVILATATTEGSGAPQGTLMRTTLWFSVSCICLIIGAVSLFLVLLLTLLMREFIYAMWCTQKKPSQGGTSNSSV